MRTKTLFIVCVVAAILLPQVTGAQVVRWTYRYDGPTSGADEATSVTWGPDDHIYVAGTTQQSTRYPLTIISLTRAGTPSWTYCDSLPYSTSDAVNSLAFDRNDNLYMPTKTWNGSSYDFGVISLSQAGAVRWRFSYNGPGNSIDEALCVLCIGDSIYAGGYSTGTSTFDDFTIVGLRPDSTKWLLQRFDGYFDEARCIVSAPVDTLYLAGRLSGAAVMALRRDGSQLWTRQLGELFQVTSIVRGPDGNLYAADNTASAFKVVSVAPDGSVRWVYTCATPGTVHAITWGPDGYLRAAGSVEGSGNIDDLAVVCLQPDSGIERWLYRYDGPGQGSDEAYSICCGLDGNLYAAGRSESTGTMYDFVVVSLTPEGTKRWIYRYNCAAANGRDEACSVICGPDGNIYAAGKSESTGTQYDVFVVSLEPTGDIEERPSLDAPSNVSWIGPNPCRGILNLHLPASASLGPQATCWLLDVTGRKAIDLRPGTNDVRHLAPGVYFLRRGKENLTIKIAIQQ